MRLVLHIGTDKTGSTAIQQHLYLNRDWLHRHGVHVPATGLGAVNGHAALFEVDDPHRLVQLVEELERARGHGARLAVLSWEGLRNYSRRRIRRLRRWLGADRDITVLAYLREQADIVQTGYLQRVKEELAHPLPMAAFERPRGPLQGVRSRYTRCHPSRDYFRLLERWRRALHTDDFVVRVFSRECLYRSDVVDDFLLQLALRADPEFVRLPERVNPSLDVETAYLLQGWREQGSGAVELRRRIDVALSIIAAEGAGQKYFLSEAGVAAIRAHYRDSNRKLAKHYLTDPTAGFDLDRPCWRQPGDRSLAERVERRAEAIAVIDATPTHFGPPLTGAAMQQGVALYRGWQQGESWGWWSDGRESVLRLRLLRQNLFPSRQGVSLFIRGRYYAANQHTEVVINGECRGEHHLGHGHPGFALALQRLQPHEVVEIVLRHQHPTSPRQWEQTEDDRQLAFGIESIGYQARP